MPNEPSEAGRGRKLLEHRPRYPRPLSTVLFTSLALALLACTSEESPTQPGTAGDLTASSALAAAPNTWTTVAPGKDLSGIAAGVAPNTAGQQILYTFGGFDGIRSAVGRVGAYNPATDTWTYKESPVGLFNTNGVGKLGSKLYFSGGYSALSDGIPFSNKYLWAYDYGGDRMIRKADLPIASGEGVSGVIDGKLYVLPGACGGDRYPITPGYCAVERTRRFYRYDPVTNKWIGRAWAPHFHRRGVGGVINGKFYVVGGFNDFQPASDLDVYDPANNTWRTLAPLPIGAPEIGAVIQGGLFVIAASHAYFYNPVTNRWTAKAAPKVGHSALARVAINGRTYLVATGGSHLDELDNAQTNGTEVYTP